MAVLVAVLAIVLVHATLVVLVVAELLAVDIVTILVVEVAVLVAEVGVRMLVLQIVEMDAQAVKVPALKTV